MIADDHRGAAERRDEVEHGLRERRHVVLAPRCDRSVDAQEARVRSHQEPEHAEHDAADHEDDERERQEQAGFRLRVQPGAPPGPARALDPVRDGVGRTGGRGVDARVPPHRDPEAHAENERGPEQDERDEQGRPPGDVTEFTSCLPAWAGGETLTVDTREQPPRSDNRVHPIVATLGVAIVGYLVVAAMALALGALVTNFVVGHGLGRDDLDIVRWLADRRTTTWNDISLVGSYLADTVVVLAVLAIALVVLAIRRNWPQFGLVVVSLGVEIAVY